MNTITFPFFITYYLSTAGREASLLSGGDGKQRQICKSEITLEQAKRIGLYVGDHGGLNSTSVDLAVSAVPKWKTHISNEWDCRTVELDTIPTADELWNTVVDLHDRRQALLAADAAERDAVAAAYLANGEGGQWIGRYNNEFLLQGAQWSHRFTQGPVFEAASARRDAERAAAAERERIQREQRLAEAQKIEDAKAAQIADWVNKFGDENQKERLNAGMFPQAEAITAIKDDTFSLLGSYQPYDRITRYDIPCDCWETDISCETFDNAPATADQWNTIKTMRALLPQATFTLRRHYCKCDGCDASIEKFSIYVKITVGAFTFNRNYAA